MLRQRFAALSPGLSRNPHPGTRNPMHRLVHSGFLRLCLSVGWLPLLVAADTSGPSMPTQFAPVADLARQVEYFVDGLRKDLAEAGDYGEDQQSRVAKNASTLAVISLVLANHDQKSDLENSSETLSASALLVAAQGLADDAGEFGAAEAAFAKVEAALVGGQGDTEVDWQPVAELSVLMQQVPIINNSLRRGVTGRRFKRQIDKTAGLAATLAALAHVSALDTDYCSSDDDEQAWREICYELRDAAAEIRIAVRREDQDAAKAGLARAVESCDACHERFRD